MSDNTNKIIENEDKVETIENINEEIVATKKAGRPKKTSVENLKEEIQDEDQEDLDLINSIKGALGSKEDSSKRKIVEAPNDDYMVKCSSLVHGVLVFTNPDTGATYHWAEIDDFIMLPMRELRKMSHTSPSIMFKPMMLIEDPKVVSFFNLWDTYKKVSNLAMINKFVEEDDIEGFKNAIKQLISVGMKQIVISKLMKMRETKELKNIDFITALKKEFKIDLM